MVSQIGPLSVLGEKVRVKVLSQIVWKQYLALNCTHDKNCIPLIQVIALGQRGEFKDTRLVSEVINQCPYHADTFF